MLTHARREAAATPIDPDALEAARLANLRYVSDEAPGITRRRQGSGFSYWYADATRVRDPADLARIRALAIPPAWTDVWICASANGHMQATGRDARRRKQYRYHARWRAVRDEAKYERLAAFGAALPSIRRRTAAALRQTALTRDRVIATVVQLLEKTLIRVGNEEYARANGSFGLTTMRDRHAVIKGSTMLFDFRAKSGIAQQVRLSDRRLARVVKRCQELPGQTLFQYIGDDGQPQSVDSADVNAYLQAVTGQDFTAKDFRTWAGTVLAAQALCALEITERVTINKRNVVDAVKRVSSRLGNTAAVCRKCYIHPAVLEAYLDGVTIDTLASRVRLVRPRATGLSPIESAVLRLLKKQARKRSVTRRPGPRRAAAA